MTPECQRLGLVASPIHSPAEVEALRLIRNACKDGFSYDHDEISQEQQAIWWRQMRDRVRAWLYSVGDEIVGYGLVRQTDDQRWRSSVAVLPGHAGKGYGGAITADLIRRIGWPVWGTALLSNPLGMRLHRADDWDELYRDDEHVYFRTKPHIYYDAAIDDYAEAINNGVATRSV